jgi:hypothetical protein
MLVTLADATASTNTKEKFCKKGIRFFCKKYNLDYNDFRSNGIEEEVLLALNDTMANKVVEVAHGRRK